GQDYEGLDHWERRHVVHRFEAALRLLGERSRVYQWFSHPEGVLIAQLHDHLRRRRTTRRYRRPASGDWCQRNLIPIVMAMRVSGSHPRRNSGATNICEQRAMRAPAPADIVPSLDVNRTSAVDPGPPPTRVVCRRYPPPAARYGTTRRLPSSRTLSNVMLAVPVRF